METKIELLPFDIEKAKAGADIVTEDYDPVRIICYDRIGDAPIVALVKSKDGNYENMYCFSKEGVAGSLVYGVKLKIVKIKKKVTKYGVMTEAHINTYGERIISIAEYNSEEEASAVWGEKGMRVKISYWI